MSFAKEPNSSRASDDATNIHNVRRTFYVAPIEKHITEDKIKKYSENFGKVESVEIHPNKSFQSAFVQFKDVSSADALDYWFANSYRRQHQIEYCVGDVRAAHLLCQPDFEWQPLGSLSMPPDQESASHILNALNDDCFEKVFKYLNAMDLTNAAEVCVHFNQLAKGAFAKKYKTLDLSYYHVGAEEIKRYIAECLLHNFGSTIYSLHVDGRVLELRTDFLHLISTNCTQLKELKIESFTMEEGMQNKIQPLFKMLQSLHLSACYRLENMENLLANCDELKVLSIAGCSLGGGDCIQQKFAKLEEFFSFFNRGFGNDALKQFITLNPSLLKLSLTKNAIRIQSETAYLISNGLPNLLELEFEENINDDFFQNLGPFNSLRVLKFNLNWKSVTPLLKNLVDNKTPIEHLKLSEAIIDDDATEYISQLKRLKIIDFFFKRPELTDDHFIKWAKELPHLEELHLTDSSLPSKISTIGLKKMLLHAHKLSLLRLEPVYSILIDVDDYKAMLKTVESRPEKVKLLIEIRSSGDKVKVPDEILAANREIFYINEDVEW